MFLFGKLHGDLHTFTGYKIYKISLQHCDSINQMASLSGKISEKIKKKPKVSIPDVQKTPIKSNPASKTELKEQMSKGNVRKLGTSTPSISCWLITKYYLCQYQITVKFIKQKSYVTCSERLIKVNI